MVIGLQTTGEAAADSMGLEPGQSCGSVSTTKQMLRHFVATHFPLKRETQKNGGPLQTSASLILTQIPHHSISRVQRIPFKRKAKSQRGAEGKGALFSPGPVCRDVCHVWLFLLPWVDRYLDCAGKSSIKAPEGAPEEGAIVPECLEMQRSLLQV